MYIIINKYREGIEAHTHMPIYIIFILHNVFVLNRNDDVVDDDVCVWYL